MSASATVIDVIDFDDFAIPVMTLTLNRWCRECRHRNGFSVTPGDVSAIQQILDARFGSRNGGRDTRYPEPIRPFNPTDYRWPVRFRMLLNC